MNFPYFLAVCKDRRFDKSGFWYTVYFVNNTAKKIDEIYMETYGFASWGDDLVQTNTVHKQFGPIEPYSYAQMEINDEGAFDFVIIYNFYLKIAGEIIERSTTIGKYLSGGVKPFEPLPVLNKFGYKFGLK